MIVVNLYGQPGSGKSTNASMLFSMLKDEGINCELINEFAKDLVWEERKNALSNQLYIFAKQYHKIYRVKDKVDVIITDSPILLSGFYDGDNGFKNLLPLIKEVDEGLNPINFFLNRVKKYNPVGRLQTEEESDKISLDLKNFLNKNKIYYYEINGDANGCENMKEIILEELKWDKL